MKALTFDPVKIRAAIKARCPQLDDVAIQAIMQVATEIVALLVQGREARIAARGESWRSLDAFAEAVAALFTVESMSQSDDDAHGTHALLEQIDQAVHSVYCNDCEHHGEPVGPPPVGMFAAHPRSGGYRN